MPSALLRQLGAEQEEFVINRGFEKHLILYPKKVWDLKVEEFERLNLYDSQHRQVVRYFYRGASEIRIDSASRILLPKSLMDYAGIQADVMVFAYQQLIELWSKDRYEQMISQEPEDFSSIAHQVFSKSDRSHD